MSVVVRGMEVPKRCQNCRIGETDETGDAYCLLLDEWADREDYEPLPNCPLLPLPDGHGDLIDRDAVQIPSGNGLTWEGMIESIVFARMLSNQPVIVSAERKDT